MSDSETEWMEAQQARLQRESVDIAEALDLWAALRVVGRPSPIGSSLLGLMTWRDIDVHVYCEPLDVHRCFTALRPIAANPGTERVSFVNRTGARSQPGEPDGYYAGIRYRHENGEQWKLDIWFVHAVDWEKDLVLMSGIQERLTPATRRTILQLKSRWHERPEYRFTVLSVDIYQAVLDYGVTTSEEFEQYLRSAGKLPSE